MLSFIIDTGTHTKKKLTYVDRVEKRDDDDDDDDIVVVVRRIV